MSLYILLYWVALHVVLPTSTFCSYFTFALSLDSVANVLSKTSDTTEAASGSASKAAADAKGNFLNAD